MIFVTVGTQLPFDRLVCAVDRWAQESNISDVVAQIGPSSYAPKAFRCVQFLEPAEFETHLQSADLIVGHAGMGTILSALQYGRRLLMMPRRMKLSEIRNDHQLATARYFAKLRMVQVAMDEDELIARLRQSAASEPAGKTISAWASTELVDKLRAFIRAPSSGAGAAVFARRSLSQ